MYYKVPVEISKQEDGLWRVEAPGLQGCFVDAETLERALAEIHEVIAMMLDIRQEEGLPLPADVTPGEALPIGTTVLVCPSEHRFRRFPLHGPKERRSSKTAERR